MEIQVEIRDTKAVVPSRANLSDIGLDLVAIRVHKTIGSNTVMFDTGIAVKPPKGYYLEIIPRSSLSKTGWMLSNSVGIVDPDYTGNLYIVLTRTRDDADVLETPFCKCQLVLRKAEYANVTVVDKLETTVRGQGGFGSTGSRV